MIAVKSIVMEERENVKEKEWKNIYTCQRCFKDTHNITYIPGSTFTKGVCDDCKEIVEEIVEKGGIV